MPAISVFESHLKLTAEAAALRDGFLRWQCRVRQIAMRDRQGCPDDAIMPTVFLDGEDEPFGQIITVLNKNATHSVTPELTQIGRATFDPAERRSKALSFLSASYYQKHREFDDTLTAVFQPGSMGAERIRAASPVRLVFNAYSQHFDLRCHARALGETHPLFQATWRHNVLFNPALQADCVILAFMPDWARCAADPSIKRGLLT